ncbi:MAG: 1-acyl-sn-glycerol-3-phosphate acyltransferase [Bacilli bacterium]|nr:1-acyl-sn-glycerol-3-phosphate acyltransferase [Bacilli bacterium]
MKKEKMFLYKILKPILGIIYKLWYNPKIIGAENIPDKGSILIVGNHIHLMDQCNVIISTTRVLHFMAKKEYFDSKFAWFFKNVGCIPVDRSKKDELATNKAIEVLNNNLALGLFPEGTRNGLKEEKIKEIYNLYLKDNLPYQEALIKLKKNKTSQYNFLEDLLLKKIITKDEFIDNIFEIDEFLKDLIINKRITTEEYFSNLLLPFKFGAVSMASKTNSYLVPYAITGEYKFRSKNLVIRIGKSFKIGNDLEKENQRLYEEIKKLMKENLNNNGK